MTPSWGPADLVAALPAGPVALLGGLHLEGRRCTLVGWAPAAYVHSPEEAERAAREISLPPEAPPLLGAAVGNIDWDGKLQGWVPGAAALFDPEGGRLWVRGALPAVAAALPAEEESLPPVNARIGWSREGFCAAVREAQAHFAAGELEKVILSVPFAAPCGLSPLAVWRRLASGDPPGFRFLLDDGPEGGALIGVSPEPLVHLTGRRAEMHLLAGTRAEGEGLAEELQQNPKDRREHGVAVEQARQDLLTACTPESVTVDRFMQIERHPGLIHLASSLSGTLRPGISGGDLVKAVFPAGTVGGVPREPARRLIAHLEPEPRTWYAGAVGAFLPDGDLQLWLTIRSLWLEEGVGYVRTGAGLVPESRPEQEWQECLNKARRALAALGAEVTPGGSA